MVYASHIHRVYNLARSNKVYTIINKAYAMLSLVYTMFDRAILSLSRRASAGGACVSILDIRFAKLPEPVENLPFTDWKKTS